MIEGKKPSGGAPHATAHCDMPDCKRNEVVACSYIRGQNRGGPPASVPDEKQVHSKLTHQGWTYIKGKLRCPSCEAKRKVVPMKSPQKTQQKPETPREPTRAQKREIMDMLETAYDVDAERYTGGDTDETVAEVLKVMPGWVEQIREDFFGPAGGNEDIAALRVEVEAFSVEATRMLKACTDANEGLIKVMERAKGYRERLEQVEKAVGPRVLRRA